MKNIICIPFAFDDEMNSGVNLAEVKNKYDLYLKNAIVALVSIKKYNPNDRVLFATNHSETMLPANIYNILKYYNIEILYIPFDRFRFPQNYLWALAFYKLCVLSYLCELNDVENICYLDSDIIAQGSFEGIWEECKYNIMLYDINHGMSAINYRSFCDEIENYCNRPNLITHYGGEFFAANQRFSKMFVNNANEIFHFMEMKNFVTKMGDEFIVSLAANHLKQNVKNAGAYICRYWTGLSFRLVSSNYKYNAVTVLHLPAEKNLGIIKVFNYIDKHKKFPQKQMVWRMCRLSNVPLYARIKYKLMHW